MISPVSLSRGPSRPPNCPDELDFSLILPTYNERENLAPLLVRIGKVLTGGKFEVILVDDDSPDETWLEAQRFQHYYKWLRVIRRQGERGLSSAVICGFRHARGKILGVMDADLQHDHTLLPQLLREMGHADFAIATRRTAGGSDGKWSRRRRFVSWVATSITKVIAGAPLSDPMSGFFAMRRQIFTAIDDWAMRPRGYKILLFLYARAAGHFGPQKIRIKEVGYKFGRRQHGHSKFTPKVMFEFLGMLVRLRIQSRHA